jgi:hypothetical protein
VATTTERGLPATGYVYYVRLIDGGGLQTGSGSSIRSLDDVRRQLESENFVQLGDELIVRSSDVHSVHRLDDEDGNGQGLIDSLKQRLGGDDMATTERQTRSHDGPGVADQFFGYGHRPWAETKPFFMTSEFLTWLVVGIGVLVAAWQTDNLEAPRAWMLVTGLTAAYILSRGIAKAGTRDPNPELFDPSRRR